MTRPRGRPRTERAIPAAERARRFRAPGEQDVLRRFCARLEELPRVPLRVAVFGSRARGDSHPHSDLDVAVFLDVARDRAVETQLSAFAELAARRFHAGGYGIHLRPVPLCEAFDAVFIEGIRSEMETIWTAPK